jgi:hypothetical protein
MASRKKKDDGDGWLLLLIFGLGALALGGAAKGDGGGDTIGDKLDDDDDLSKFPIFNVVPGTIPTPDPTPGRPGGPTEPIFPTVEPKKPADPGGPTPGQIDDLLDPYPTPGTFYQVVTGDNFTGDNGIATRLARSALFLAAQEAGGLSQDDAIAWAKVRDGYATARRPVTQWIACAPFNDALYATYAFSDKSIPGMQGRAIRLLNTSAPNVARIRQGEPPIRNVRICAPGDPPSCSSSPVNGAYRGRELLWMPGFDLQRLWDSGGSDWKPGGVWGDGTTKILPPPKIWALGILDVSESGRSSWGCAPWQREVPSG